VDQPRSVSAGDVGSLVPRPDGDPRAGSSL